MKRRTRKLLTLLLTLAMILVSIPSTSANVAAARKLKVKGKKNVTLKVGKKYKIKTNMSAKFKSSKKKIASVNKKGVVRAKKAGTAKITVTSKKNKKQKVTIKIVVKKKKSTSSTTATPGKSPLATSTPSAVVNSPTPSPTPGPTSTPEETAKAVSLSAIYSGGTMMTSATLDYTKLEVIAKFSDGSERKLPMTEYTLSSDYTLVDGETTIEVYYENLKTSFVINAKTITSEQHDFASGLDITYTGGYPFEPSKLEVTIFFIKKYVPYENPSFEDQGVVVRKDGKKYHQIFVYYSEDFELDGEKIHNFCYDLILIPVS